MWDQQGDVIALCQWGDARDCISNACRFALANGVSCVLELESGFFDWD